MNNYNKTVLVTGGAGFIGSHVVDAILKRQGRVVVLDDFNDYYDPAIKQRNLESHLHDDNLKVIKGDVRDSGLLDDVFKNFSPDSVIHLAARAGVRPSLTDPQLYFDVNVIGTLQLLEVIRRYQINNVILASSSSVYGNRAKGPFKESDATDNQVSPYGASKKSMELLANTYAHLYSIPVTCLRFFTVYGPRNRPDMACYLFTEAIEKNKEIQLYGDGSSGRDYTYVDDIVDGILQVLEHPAKYFEIVNLGNSSPVLLRDLIATLEKVTNKKAKVVKQPTQPGDVELTFADITKASKNYHFQPRKTFKVGITELVKWYQQQNSRP